MPDSGYCRRGPELGTTMLVGRAAGARVDMPVTCGGPQRRRPAPEATPA